MGASTSSFKIGTKKIYETLSYFKPINESIIAPLFKLLEAVFDSVVYGDCWLLTNLASEVRLHLWSPIDLLISLPVIGVLVALVAPILYRKAAVGFAKETTRATTINHNSFCPKDSRDRLTTSSWWLALTGCPPEFRLGSINSCASLTPLSFWGYLYSLSFIGWALRSCRCGCHFDVVIVGLSRLVNPLTAWSQKKQDQLVQKHIKKQEVQGIRVIRAGRGRDCTDFQTLSLKFCAKILRKDGFLV